MVYRAGVFAIAAVLIATCAMAAAADASCQAAHCDECAPNSSFSCSVCKGSFINQAGVCACPAGSGLYGDACKPCAPLANCDRVLCGSGLAGSQCARCDVGFYGMGYDCMACSPMTPYTDLSSCATFKPCVGGSPPRTECATCPPGASLDENGSCLQCAPIDKCAKVTCKSGAEQDSTCLECEAGNYLSNNTCVPCTPNPIAHCEDYKCDGTTGKVTCSKCESGMYPSNNGMQCAACTLPDSMCESATCSSASDSKCQACKAPFVVSSSGSTCVCPQPDQFRNGTRCDTCPNGFTYDAAQGECVCKGYLEAGTCVDSCPMEVPHCAEYAAGGCTTGTCAQCSASYALDALLQNRCEEFSSLTSECSTTCGENRSCCSQYALNDRSAPRSVSCISDESRCAASLTKPGYWVLSDGATGGSVYGIRTGGDPNSAAHAQPIGLTILALVAALVAAFAV